MTAKGILPDLHHGVERSSAIHPFGDEADMGWDEELSEAFGLLLGRKLAAYVPAATSAVYYGGDGLNEMAPPADWLSPVALADPTPRPLPDPVYLDEDHQEYAWHFDLSNSFVHFDEEVLDGPFSSAFADDVGAADA